MAIDMRAARALCSPSELQVIRAATRGEVGKLTLVQLRSKTARARKLRDKFRDLGHSQRREVRGKARPRGTTPARDNAAAIEKAALFGQALASFEKRLASLEQPARASRASTVVKDTRTKATHKKARKAGRQAAKEATRIANAAATVTEKTPKTRARVATTKAASKAPRAAASPVSTPPVPEPTPAGVPTKPTAAPRGKKSPTFASPAPPDLRARVTAQRANVPKRQAHVSSRGRRAQGRRDSR